MIHNKDSYCTRCGNCCKGLIWRRKYSFREAEKVSFGATKKEEIEKALASDYKKNLISKGQDVKKTDSIEWDYKNKVIGVCIEVGKCKHLSFLTDKKAICLNYENRPKECRDYLCKKARQKLMLEKIKESERSANNLLKSEREILCQE
jgi:hypothetical protein